MSAATINADAAAEPKKGGKKKVILLGATVLLVVLGAGLWFSGVLPHIGRAHSTVPSGDAKTKASSAKEPAHALVFADLPDIVTNLNTNSHRAMFVKLKAKFEVARPEDDAAIKAVMPRILDLFNTYLRETRPEELRSSMGTYRLREELLARAQLAAPSAEIRAVLFTELLIQ